MKLQVLKAAVSVFALGVFLLPRVFAAAPSAARARGEAQAQQFVGSPEEIVAQAKKEGALRVLYSFEPETMKAMKEGFSRKYPFIQLNVEEITGTDGAQRFLLELKAGRAANWDVAHLSSEFYADSTPYLEKVDLLGMAKQGALKIPPKMIDPRNRNALAAATIMGGIAYNRKLLPPGDAPRKWEDLLKTEYKGRKFLAELRPNNLAGLIPAKGKEWVLDFGRRLASQEPIWVRGATRALTALATGEYALHSGVYYHTAIRLKQKGAEDLEVLLPEPVPVRLNQPYGIVRGAKHRHAAMLFLEYICGAEGQKIIDDLEPLKSSLHFPGSRVEQILSGRQLSVVDWDHFDKMGLYMEEIFQSFGMPKASR